MHTPTWTNECEGWACNHVTRNAWKYETMTHDDLMNEAFLMFAYVRDKYETKTPAHFMSLFKLAVTQHLLDLAARVTRGRMLTSPEEAGLEMEEFVLDRFDDLADAELKMDMGEADSLLVLLLERSSTYRGSRKRRVREGKRETANDVLSRIAGVRADFAGLLSRITGLDVEAACQ